MFIRNHSIQDYLKNINSSLSVLDCVTVSVVFFILLFGTVVIYKKNLSEKKDGVYHEVTDITTASSYSASLPFGSRKGATYTFSWCSGSSRILEKNRVYFQSEAEAKALGRRLSKLCKWWGCRWWAVTYINKDTWSFLYPLGVLWRVYILEVYGKRNKDTQKRNQKTKEDYC